MLFSIDIARTISLAHIEHGSERTGNNNALQGRVAMLDCVKDSDRTLDGWDEQIS
jgi:hypothetical protein